MSSDRLMGEVQPSLDSLISLVIYDLNNYKMLHEFKPWSQGQAVVSLARNNKFSIN